MPFPADLLSFAEAESRRAEESVLDALVSLQKQSNTLLSIQLLLIAAAVGHAVDLIVNGGEVEFASAAVVLALWLVGVGMWTASTCFATGEWYPEGTEPANLLLEGLSAEDARAQQLDHVQEKLTFNKGRTVELAARLDRARELTVLSPLVWPAGLLVGWFIASAIAA